MYQAILVDDEEEVRSGIANMIDWMRLGFAAPGQAENGREALDMIEEAVPDVVITDISMPLIDGLDLAGAIQQRFPTVKTVILTGYDDFKFAQQAIRFGVADYLLKPVLPSDIEALLDKLRTRLDAEAAEKEDVDRLRRNYREALPILREKYLSSLVSGGLVDQPAPYGIAEIHLNLSEGAIVAAAVQVDEPSLAGSALAAESGALAAIAVLDIARDVLQRHDCGEAFLHEGAVAVLLGFAPADRTELENRAIQLLEEIRQTVEKFHRFTVTIGLGDVSPSPDRIHASYSAALAALEYRIVTGGNRVICRRDIEPGSAEGFSFDESRERLFATKLKFGTTREVTDSVDNLFRELAEVHGTPADQRLFFLELIAAISRVSRAYRLDLAEAMGSTSPDLYAQISRLDTPGKAREWFVGLCQTVNRDIRGIHQASTQTILDKAKAYIQAQYADNELSVQKLADHLHISSSYLNTIFKKDAGVSFLKYLVGVRLEVATDLLARTDLKSAEIAERIGYPDINYFSYFFKKNYGMSPREYRGQIKAKQNHGS